jgi:hypothetical protein
MPQLENASLASAAIRIGISLASYLTTALLFALLLLCFSWTPLSSAVPMILYAESYTLVLWLCGVWALCAAIPLRLQLRDWRLTTALSGLHAFLVVCICYWLIYGRSTVASQFDWLMFCFFLVFALGGAAAGFVYFYAMSRLQTPAVRANSSVLGLDGNS